MHWMMTMNSSNKKMIVDVAVTVKYDDFSSLSIQLTVSVSDHHAIH